MPSILESHMSNLVLPISFQTLMAGWYIYLKYGQALVKSEWWVTVLNVLILGLSIQRRQWRILGLLNTESTRDWENEDNMVLFLYLNVL